jgi:hypothetical protein
MTNRLHKSILQTKIRQIRKALDNKLDSLLTKLCMRCFEANIQNLTLILFSSLIDSWQHIFRFYLYFIWAYWNFEYKNGKRVVSARRASSKNRHFAVIVLTRTRTKVIQTTTLRWILKMLFQQPTLVLI